ncbi:hypothetical protein BJ992_003015 [Sphaerisporangium rubeum]|uniref:Uncharacterized protein n=1 Tax=Sphaerisporangium rubeum TaxID=321317 RepID=A0A7X0M810_9ACTN|nr:hypothetical protein [Sphaerisporangium rubeum]
MKRPESTIDCMLLTSPAGVCDVAGPQQVEAWT